VAKTIPKRNNNEEKPSVKSKRLVHYRKRFAPPQPYGVHFYQNMRPLPEKVYCGLPAKEAEAQ